MDLRTRRVVLAVLLLLAGAWQVRYSWGVLRLVFAPHTVAQQPFTVRLSTGALVTLQPAAVAAGLREGDLLLAVDGASYRGRGDLARPLARKRPGAALPVEVQRGDGVQRHTVTLDAVSRTGGAGQNLATLVIGVLTPALCLGLGFAVAFLRPFDGRALILLLLMLSFVHMHGYAEAGPTGWTPVAAAVLATAYRGLMGLTWPLAIFALGVAFPERLDLDRRHPWLKWLVIGPLAAVAILYGVAEAVAVTDRVLASTLSAPLARVWSVLPLVFFLVIGLFFAMIGYRWGTATAPDTQRRLRLLMSGCGLSLAPAGLLVLLATVRGAQLADLPPWLVGLGLAPVPLFPATLAYVIVVHQALDVKVVVRQGVQYALARNGVIVLQAIASVLILFGALSLAADPGTNRPRRIILMAAGLMFIFGLQAAAGRLRGFIDRRFFRQAYDAEQLLSHLGDDVRTVMDSDELLATLTRRLRDTLHARRVSILLLRGDRFVLARSAGDTEVDEVSLPRFSAAAERVKLTGQPLRLHWDDAASWVHRHGTDDERATLRALEAEMVMPLSARERLLGLLVLGSKLSDEPWSPSEVRLLQTVAAQASVALENAQLTTAMAAEVARRERLNREIEIAREVQEGLFPQVMPLVDRVELAGMCRPALGVGGDYYDFIDLPGRQLGLAVGDVSGKGIPAALLMSALRAALRAQTTFGSGDVAVIMERLNQLIFESSPPNRYVTFFYGQFDPVTRRLVYVNAGHLPPLVFRDGQDAPLRLEEGGPVIGLLPVTSYVAGSIVLQPNDLLVAFSDGVSEAMNVEDEEYGEDRLCRAIRTAPAGAPAPVVRHVLEHLDAFVGPAKQHDDITLIALRAG